MPPELAAGDNAERQCLGDSQRFEQQPDGQMRCF